VESSTMRMPCHFVAVIPPANTLDAIVELQKTLDTRMSGTRIRWVPRENLHFTLRFFGSDLADEQLFKVAHQVMTQVVCSTKQFEIQIKGLGVFPKWKKPRVLYLGVGKGETEFKNLVSILDREWTSKKMPQTKEVKLVPHLTIGRWNDLYVKKIQGDILKDVIGEFSEPISSFVGMLGQQQQQ